MFLLFMLFTTLGGVAVYAANCTQSGYGGAAKGCTGPVVFVSYFVVKNSSST